jgi:lipopolysaccharide transport system ATP-binding protein
VIRLRIDRLDLAAGNYHITVGLFSSDWTEGYDYHAEAYPLTLVGQEASKGFFAPPTEWEFEPEEVPLESVEAPSRAGGTPRR